MEVEVILMLVVEYNKTLSLFLSSFFCWSCQGGRFMAIMFCIFDADAIVCDFRL